MRERITTRALLIYLATMMTLGVLVAAIAWFILGAATNLANEPRAFIASQVPIALVLIAWIAAVTTEPR